jgi:hypothetical protein
LREHGIFSRDVCMDWRFVLLYKMLFIFIYVKKLYIDKKMLVTAQGKCVRIMVFNWDYAIHNYCIHIGFTLHITKVFSFVHIVFLKYFSQFTCLSQYQCNFIQTTAVNKILYIFYFLDH